MAYGLKCYCCGINAPVSSELYLCKSCLLLLSEKFQEKSSDILENPKHFNHCVCCGEWENRRIVYTGSIKIFSEHAGDGVPICDRCVEEELKLSVR